MEKEYNSSNKLNQPLNCQSKRYIQLDYAKALGILLVVYGHSIEETTLKGVISDLGSQIKIWIYCFHMPLFFILSGLGLYFKYSSKIQLFDYSKEIKILSKKLLIPYFYWSFIYLVGKILSAILINKKPIITIILERTYAFVTLRGAAPLWFLSALFLANIIYLWIINNKLLKEKPKLCHFILLFVLLYTTVLCQDWFHTNKSHLSYFYLYPITTIFRIFPSVLYIEIGFLLGHIWKRIINSNYLIKAFLFLVFTITFVTIKYNINCSMNMHTFDYDNVYTILFLGFLGSVSLILLSLLLPQNINELANIGKNTMDIMILHYPPIPILRIICIIFIKIRLGLCLCLITIITTYLCLLVSKYILKPIRNKYSSDKNQK